MEMEFANLDLAILLAYRMMDSWEGHLTVIGAVNDIRDKSRAEKFLRRLADLARLPAKTEVHVADGDFNRYASSAPEADLNVFPLPEKLEAEFLWGIRDATGSLCIFTQDSGEESALA